MKNIVIGFIGGCVIIYTAVIALGMYSVYARKNILNDSIAEVMESIMKNYYADKEARYFKNTGEDTKEVVEDEIREELKLRLQSDSRITVSVLECDLENGLLAVKAEETFTMPNGKKKTLSFHKVLIVDDAA